MSLPPCFSCEVPGGSVIIPMNRCWRAMWKLRSRPEGASFARSENGMSDLVIRNGMVVSEDGLISADIAIEDECITAVGPDLPAGAREIDGAGLTAFPGLVDVHVHFNDPGRADWEGADT